MTGTEAFKQTIQDYITDRSLADPLFADKVSNENKNIDDCIKYILNTVHKSGCNGFTDSEIFSMAVHYYEEDSVEIGNNPNLNVVVNHKVELTDEEKEKAKEKALEEVKDEQIRQLKKRGKVVKRESEKTVNAIQTTLF